MSIKLYLFVFYNSDLHLSGDPVMSHRTYTVFYLDFVAFSFILRIQYRIILLLLCDYNKHVLCPYIR